MPYPVSTIPEQSRHTLCKKISMKDTIQLRTGYMRASCISVKESRLGQIRVKVITLQQDRPPANIWDTIGVAIGVVFAVLCVLAVFIHYSYSCCLQAAPPGPSRPSWVCRATATPRRTSKQRAWAPTWPAPAT